MILAFRRYEASDFEQVHLLLAGLQPRTFKREVRPIVTQGHSDDINIETRALGSVGDVERHVMNPGKLHTCTVGLGLTG